MKFYNRRTKLFCPVFSMRFNLEVFKVKNLLALLAIIGFSASLVCAQEPAKPAAEKAPAAAAKPAAEKAPAAKPAAAPAAKPAAAKAAAKPVVVQKGRGGFMGFLAGCLFGVRSAAAYNDGKNIHWREWITLIPFVGIWNGIDGASGVTTKDYASKYGSAFY